MGGKLAEQLGGDKADPARIGAVTAAWSGEDPIKAAQEAFNWLQSISGTGEFTLARRYELIGRIDEPLKPHGERLLEQYLALKPQSKFQEGLLWKAATDYWKALGDAYGVCVAQAVAAPLAAVEFRGTLPALISRAMRAQMLQIKWILMRYGYVGDNHWREMAGLYKHAHGGGSPRAARPSGRPPAPAVPPIAAPVRPRPA